MKNKIAEKTIGKLQEPDNILTKKYIKNGKKRI